MSVHRIAICGQSLFISAIKAGLATAMLEAETVRLDARFPDLIEYITTLQPNMIITERNNAHNDLVLALVNQGLPLIELDIEQSQATLLSGVRVPVVETDDLVQVIHYRTLLDRTRINTDTHGFFVSVSSHLCKLSLYKTILGQSRKKSSEESVTSVESVSNCSLI